jgi:imidazolonepropionase-like amidohydrolase
MTFFDFTHSKFRRFSATCVLLIIVNTSRAVSGEQPTSVLLTHGVVHTITGGTLADAEVLISNGKIIQVGTNLSAEGAALVNLQGLHLYPGLISLNSSLGLTEIQAIRSTQDSTESGEFTPDVQSWIAVNPDSELLPVARANGVACFEPVPLGGLVSGQSGLVSIEGWTAEERAIRKPLALHVFWPSSDLDLAPRRPGAPPDPKYKNIEEQGRERTKKVRALADFFDDAKAYANGKPAAQDSGDKNSEMVPAWEAMIPFVRRELPIVVHADDIRQIQGAVAWSATNHFKIILAEGRDASMVANLLATNKIPVIYTRTFDLPARDTEPYDVHFRTPALLHQAGVKVIFSVGSDPGAAQFARNLPYYAAQAVAFGFPADEAIKGITLYPAELAGVSRQLGSIEAGRQATIFAATGDILDIRTQVKRMWVDGHEVSLESRHTRLYEKYRSRPKSTTAR